MSSEQPKKKVDEDWKRRAKEDALKQEAGQAAGGPAGAAEAQAGPGQAPPRLEASFAALVQSFAVEAAIALGDIENPYTGTRTRDLAHAKYAIDMLQIMAEKTKGNLAAEDKELLDRVLFDLRMRFLR